MFNALWLLTIHCVCWVNVRRASAASVDVVLRIGDRDDGEVGRRRPVEARPKNVTFSGWLSGSNTSTLRLGEVVSPVAPLAGVFSTGMFGALLNTRLNGAPATRVQPVPADRAVHRVGGRIENGCRRAGLVEAPPRDEFGRPLGIG